MWAAIQSSWTAERAHIKIICFISDLKSYICVEWENIVWTEAMIYL